MFMNLINNNKKEADLKRPHHGSRRNNVTSANQSARSAPDGPHRQRITRGRERRQRAVGRRVPFLSNFAQVSSGRTRTYFGKVSAHLVERRADMAPSTQLKEAVADVQEGIRAILLGPPGAGKGTQVRPERAELSG